MGIHQITSLGDHVADVVTRVNVALDAWRGFGPENTLAAIRDDEWFWYLEAADSRDDVGSLQLIASELANRLAEVK